LHREKRPDHRQRGAREELHPEGAQKDRVRAAVGLAGGPRRNPSGRSTKRLIATTANPPNKSNLASRQLRQTANRITNREATAIANTQIPWADRGIARSTCGAGATFCTCAYSGAPTSTAR